MYNNIPTTIRRWVKADLPRTALKYFRINPKKSYLSLSASFEYLCYESTPIINILTLVSAGIDFRRQILTFTPLTTKLFNLNFHPLEVVSR